MVKDSTAGCGLFADFPVIYPGAGQRCNRHPPGDTHGTHQVVVELDGGQLLVVAQWWEPPLVKTKDTTLRIPTVVEPAPEGPRYQSSGELDAYVDRNLAVMALARIAAQQGLRVGVKERETDWPILYIDLPTGQVSYHIPRDELHLDLPDYPDPWDGHDLAEKRRRVQAFLAPGAT